MTPNWVNITSGCGLLPDSTKPASMLTYHQYGPKTFIWEQFHEIPQPSLTEIRLKITHLKFHSILPRTNELIAFEIALAPAIMKPTYNHDASKCGHLIDKTKFRVLFYW